MTRHSATLLRLEPWQWRQRMAALARACCDAGGEAEIDAGDPDHGTLLREGYALMRLAPEAEADRVAQVPTEAQFETLVASGAWASAALALVPERAGYLLSRGEAGTHLASVVLEGPDEEIAAEAFSPALALLAALAGAFSRGSTVREGPPAGTRENEPVSLARWVPRGRPN